MVFTCTTNTGILITYDVRQSEAFERQGLKVQSANSSTLTKHHTTVSEKAIRKVWAKRKVFRKRSALISEKTKKNKRAPVGRFTELKDKLHLRIDNMGRENCLFHLQSPFSKQNKLLNN